MERQQIDLQNPDISIIKKAAAVIESGGVVVFPCDTSYGLAADYLNPQAVNRIFELKGRSPAKELSVIVKDQPMIEKFCQLDATAQQFISRYLPGPITVILPTSPEILTTNPELPSTIGVRLPGTPTTNLLSQIFDKPYTATSANLSGQPPAHTPQEILKYFSKSSHQPDLFLDAGNLPIIPPSTVVDLTQFPPRILRQGQVKVEINLDNKQ